MNKRKKLVSYFLLAVCTMMLVACAKTDTKPVEKKQEDSGSSQLVTLGYAQSGTDATWSEAFVESVKENCTEENGIKLLYENADGDFDKQVEIVRGYIEQKVDVIGFTPIYSEGWDDVLKEAKDAGIPVVILDRMVDADDDLYECWIGSNFLLEGYKATDWLMEYMETRDSGKKKGKYKVALFQGDPGSSAELGRTQGIEEMLKANKDYQIVYKDIGMFTHDGGVENMKKVLKKKLDIDILIAENDNMALGAIEVMEKNGIKPGKDIVIVSFDGIRDAFEAMIDGKINCVMECNPLSGKPFVAAIKKVLNGDPIEKRNYIQEELFPADTAADYIDHRKY